MNPDLAFDALADPVRREILAALAETDELSSGALAERITSVGRTAVSSHLRVLKIAGLVTERRAGRFRYYAVDPSGSARDVLTLLHQVFRAGLASVAEVAEGADGTGGAEDPDRAAAAEGAGIATVADLADAAGPTAVAPDSSGSLPATGTRSA